LPVQVLDELASSVEQMDPDMVMVLSKRALDAVIDPADIVENGIAKALRRVSERFEKGEAILTDLVGAAAAAKEALESVLRPAMAKARTSQRSLGKVVLGTVSGDIHAIGKNIVAAMLFASGFEVVDLGTDVSVGDFGKPRIEDPRRAVFYDSQSSWEIPCMRTDRFDLNA